MKDYGEVVVDRKARLDVCVSLRENQKDIRIGFDTDYISPQMAALRGAHNVLTR